MDFTLFCTYTTPAGNQRSIKWKKSRFIAQAVQERILQMQNDKLTALLKEWYGMMHKDTRNLSREFEAIDMEGWDEY